MCGTNADVVGGLYDCCIVYLPAGVGGRLECVIVVMEGVGGGG